MFGRLIFVFSTLFALTFFLHLSGAHAEEGHHTLGVQAGQVGLCCDVANTYSNALGGGLFFDYAASDFLEVELSWITSHHTGTSPYVVNTLNLQQNDYALALIYNVETYDIFTPYLRGGAEFVSHGQDVSVSTSTAAYNSTGFGLQVGVGARADFTSSLMAGLDVTYHSMFNATVTPPGFGTSVNVIQSFYTVMLRLGFTFGGKK